MGLSALLIVFVRATWRDREDFKTAVSPKLTQRERQLTKARNLELTAQVTGSSNSWRLFFADSSIGLSLVQITRLLSAYSRQLG